ncbi:TetR/AcrR family transcriptional regulator [Streptomyces sp. SID14478]|uniref:TetR/AcrR family transcriptional regulator n=1 Tax=Streptomyces sp. SID14478 TaxID=2706073 RepID=UPI0013DC7900|nr:TetR/AcrR family transcriptional regulator [Streptomyces sp. SID14478]NEB73664.1 TetR/AcrR family transcriptional regulator [Streptomyces sp. SID14478]
MTEPSGRRERKKAATRQRIADTALRLFLDRGYDAVGIRDVAAEADVAVTTVFAHFASKEALVYERDQDFEQRLTRAVAERPAHEPLVPALHREVQFLVRHCTAQGSAPVRRMIEESAALQEYEESMSLRHAQALAAALAADTRLGRSTTACRATARFVIDAYALACRAEDPGATVDEVFRMIDAAWEATAP